MSDLMSTYRENQQLKKNLCEAEEKAGAAIPLEDENEQLVTTSELKRPIKINTNCQRSDYPYVISLKMSWTIDKGESDNVD